MGKKKNIRKAPDDFVPAEDAILPGGSDDDFFDHINEFTDYTPRIRPINEKFDKDGLYLLQHIIICYLAIKAGSFPDDRFPHIKDKCSQYYKERNLTSVGVNLDTFYKSYSKYIQIDIEDGHRVITKEKYIGFDFIEKITPFIEQWYPGALLFVQTLNASPYRLETIHYYWIYREVKRRFRGSIEDFRKEYCSHIQYETFRTIHKRKADTEIPDEIREYITPFITFHFPNESA